MVQKKILKKILKNIGSECLPNVLIFTTMRFPKEISVFFLFVFLLFSWTWHFRDLRPQNVWFPPLNYIGSCYFPASIISRGKLTYPLSPRMRIAPSKTDFQKMQFSQSPLQKNWLLCFGGDRRQFWKWKAFCCNRIKNHNGMMKI